MQHDTTIREQWSRFISRRFGRSFRLPLDLVRLLIAVAGLIPCVSALLEGVQTMPISCFAFALMLVWAVLISVMPLVSWRWDIQMGGIVMVADFIIITILVIADQPLVLQVFPYTLLLFLILQVNFLRLLQAAIISTIVILIAAFGLEAPAVFDQGTISHERLIERVIYVVTALLTLMTFRAARSFRLWFRLWADGLLIAGTHAKTVPLDFLFEQMHLLFGHDHIWWLEHEDGDAPRLLHLLDGVLIEQPVQQLEWDRAKPWILAQRSFNYDADRSLALTGAEIELISISHAEAPAQFIRSIASDRYWMSFPVRVADTASRVFVGMPGRPCITALREAGRVGKALEAVFERFMFQSAWRERATSEARLSLGRDVHDTVLQTMASLRMHIAGLLSKSEFSKRPHVKAALLDLQKTVAEEQTSFRELLGEDRRNAAAPVDLNAILSRRVEALAPQWSINCVFHPSVEQVLVSGDTAVEVEFLVREVVSNAVQHGKVQRLSVRLAVTGRMLLLSVLNDDRVGHRGAESEPAAKVSVRSRSLARRLTYLGASAYVEGVKQGSLLSIRIPLTGEQNGELAAGG